MEFEIGHGPRRVMNRLAVHSHDKADQRFGVRKEAQDVITFRRKLRSIDLNKTDIVGAGFKNGLAQFLRVEYDRRGAYRARGPFAKSFDAWVLGFFWQCWISSLLTISVRLSCRPLPNRGFQRWLINLVTLSESMARVALPSTLGVDGGIIRSLVRRGARVAPAGQTESHSRLTHRVSLPPESRRERGH